MTYQMSYSQMTTFECHRRWYNRYVAKMGTYDPQAFVFGREVHKALEQRITRKIAYSFIELKNESDKKQAAVLTAAGLGKLSDLFGGDWLNYAVPENVELKLHTSMFNGVIDFLYCDKNAKYYIVDWKTTSWENDYDEHRLLTDQQLTSYYYLVYKCLGFIVDEAMFITLNKKTGGAKSFSTTRNLKDIEEFEEKIKITWENSRKQPRDRNPSLCISQWGTCEFYKNCWGKDYAPTLPSLK